MRAPLDDDLEVGDGGVRRRVGRQLRRLELLEVPTTPAGAALRRAAPSTGATAEAGRGRATAGTAAEAAAATGATAESATATAAGPPRPGGPPPRAGRPSPGGLRRRGPRRGAGAGRSAATRGRRDGATGIRRGRTGGRRDGPARRADGRDARAGRGGEPGAGARRCPEVRRSWSRTRRRRAGPDGPAGGARRGGRERAAPQAGAGGRAAGGGGTETSLAGRLVTRRWRSGVGADAGRCRRGGAAGRAPATPASRTSDPFEGEPRDRGSGGGGGLVLGCPPGARRLGPGRLLLGRLLGLRRRDEAPRCRPCAGRGRLGRPRSRRSGSSPRCPATRRGRGPPCSSGRAHVPARRRGIFFGKGSYDPSCSFGGEPGNRPDPPSSHTWAPALAGRRTASAAAYGGVRPPRARHRHAAPAQRLAPRRLVEARASPGTTTPRGPGPGPRPAPRRALARHPDQLGGRRGPPAADAGAAGRLCRALRLARLPGADASSGFCRLRSAPERLVRPPAPVARRRRRARPASSRRSPGFCLRAPRPTTTRDHSAAETASPPSAGCHTISPASFSTHSPSAHSSP